jgi:hypothetical protein
MSIGSEGGEIKSKGPRGNVPSPLHEPRADGAPLTMPFRTGDIDELYEWSDDDRSDYSERPEEKRVGTQGTCVRTTTTRLSY